MITVSESVGVALNLNAARFDSVTVAESVVVRLTRLTVTLADGVSVSEFVSRSIGGSIGTLFIEVSDAVTIGFIAHNSMSVFDAVSITEFVNARVSRLLANVSDAVSVTESRSVTIGGSPMFNPAWTLGSNQLIS